MEMEIRSQKRSCPYFPHKMNGEGHFLALLKNRDSRICPAARPDANTENGGTFLEEIVYRPWVEKPLTGTGWKPEAVYYLPPVNTSFRDLPFSATACIWAI